MAVFAKAMTNGYPLAAVIGKYEIMDAAQGTFISSTFFTERIALAAALRSVRLYQENRVWEKQAEYGQRVRSGWKNLSEDTGLDIETGGIVPLSHFTVKGPENPLVYQTYITQEMLKKGFLASTSFYSSYAHSEEVIDCYLSVLHDVFSVMADTVKQNGKVGALLEGPVCHGHFGRLN